MAAAKSKGKKPKKTDNSAKQGKPKSVAQIAADCNKALGKEGAVILGKDMPKAKRHSTGVAAIDYVTGGGLKEGTLTQYTGAESTFKSTAAIITCATAQAADPNAQVVWVAGEPFDAEWAEFWGMDMSRTFVVIAENGGSSLETAATLLDSNVVAVMVLDSYQSLGTEREMDGGVDSEAYAGGGAPQLWGRMMRRAYVAANRGSKTRIIGISQVRAKIGGFSPHGPTSEGSGIYALKHWKSIDVDFTRGEVEKDGAEEMQELISMRVKVRNIKNKTAEPRRVSSILVEYTKHGPRVNNVDALVKLGIKYGIIKDVGGARYKGVGIPKTHGKDAFVAKLKRDAEAVCLLEERLMEMYAKG